MRRYATHKSKAPTPKVKTTIGLKVNSCLKLYLSHNIKTSAANLMKLHWKIKHKDKVSHIQDLDCHAQGRHCRVKGQNMFLQLL